MHQRLIDGWLNYLAAERGLLPRTQNAYARDIGLLSEAHPAQALNELSSQDIRRLLATLHKGGLSGRSLARVLSAWRSFYAYLVRRHNALHNPCDGIRAPRAGQLLPHSLSVEQVMHLIDVPGQAASALGQRDTVMCELFYSSGLRLSELASLRQNQLDLKQGEIRVVGKGNKTRIVPIGKAAVAALTNWLSQRSANALQSNDYLFPGRKPNQHLSQRAIELRVAHRAREAQLDEHVHPHMLRHAFASHLLQSSGDLRAVQEMLGHEHIRSTQIYTRLDFQHLAKVYDQAHPRAKKKVD
ncbi:MAG: tyrosine recombinase XerC [Betaproteobacteria bacterium]|nr:tyrosine recombinase XerC [Betaproteobacteria bacterium]